MLILKGLTARRAMQTKLEAARTPHCFKERSYQKYKFLPKLRYRREIKAGVNVKAVFTSLNTAFLPISRSRFKRRQIPMLITLSTIWQFCVNFWVIFRCFGKERFFLKG